MIALIGWLGFDTIILAIILVVYISLGNYIFDKGAKGKRTWIIVWSCPVALGLLALAILIPSYVVAADHFHSDVRSAAAKQHLHIANVSFDEKEVDVIGDGCRITATVTSGNIMLSETEGEVNLLSPQLLARICK